MLTVLRDPSGQLQAACEWWPVAPGGTDPDWTYPAPWLRVEQVDVSKGVQKMNILHTLIQTIAELMPNAVGCYFVRRDKRNPVKLHYWTRAQLVRGGMANATV